MAGGIKGTLLRARGRNNEGVVGLAIIILVLVVGSIDHSFWSAATVFNLFRNSYEPLVFALGVFLVLLIGGIDVSFDAIGIFAGYSVAILIGQGHLGGGLWVYFLVAAGIGLMLGAFNALVVATFRLPVLIVTLGTRGIFVGVLLTAIGSAYVNNLPPSIQSFGSSYLVTVRTPSGQVAGLQTLVIPVALLCVLVAIVLRYTVLGRGVYAVGGGEETARRAGFSVGTIKTVVFCVAGLLAGFAGMIHVSLIGFADPQDLVGNELIVIAAVVFGGASIFGGRGSVGGTVLGVLLLELIQYALITLKIPSSWDNVAIGGLLLAGMILQVARYGGGWRTFRMRMQTRLSGATE
jgi:simple sugar transport system permease protein